MEYRNDTVRRQDRLLDETAARELLRRGEYGFLAMQEIDGGGYGIPVSYVWDGDGAVYVHCAPEGHKLRCIVRQPRVTLCVVGPTRIVPEQFTTAYASILLHGEARTGLPEEERRAALSLLIRKYALEHAETGATYAERSFHRTEIVRIDIRTVSGKCKRVR